MIKKILFVDDNLEIVEAAKTALEMYEYFVKSAYSGKEALKKLDDVDLVILDIKMPEMSGIETLKHIKNKKPMLPVIMITAYATVDTAIEAMKLGAIDYIKKPFDFQELEKGILAAIEDIKFRNVKDIYSENCYERFNKLTETNKGLCISRTFESITNKENVEMISIEENLRPKPIENLRKEIEDTLSKEINTVMLTNIEYLIKFNKSDEVQLFLRWLNKQTLLNNGKLILSANLQTTGDKEQKMLRDMITDIHLGLFSDSISNYLRRKIIIKLADGQKHTFTKIANDLKIEDNPKLSFHLKKLKEDGMIEQDSEKKYFLSALGTEIAELIEKIKKEKLKTKDDILWMPFT